MRAGYVLPIWSNMENKESTKHRLKYKYDIDKIIFRNQQQKIEKEKKKRLTYDTFGKGIAFKSS